MWLKRVSVCGLWAVDCGTGISDPSLRLQADRLTNYFAFEMRLLKSWQLRRMGRCEL